MAESDDKTESPTARRLSQARDDGNVALSRELPLLVSLGVLWLMLVMSIPATARDLYAWMAGFLGNIHRIDMSDNGVAAMAMAARVSLRAVLPIGVVAASAGALTTLVQTRFLFALSKLKPDLAKLNPQRGIKRLFSTTNLIEAAKATAKVLVVGYACYHVLFAYLPDLQRSMDWTPAVLLDRTMRVVLKVLLTMLAAQGIVSAVDVFWTHYKHGRDLRMSRSEVKQEHKDQEGDPIIRARLRQIRAIRARRRMREAMKRATVVVANPTHYAVALRYERERNAAPVVVAKGVDSMAARIRETAAEFGVPVVVNPPLARALHKVELEADIPPELYKAVAELIAYVWRLNRRRLPGAAA